MCTLVRCSFSVLDKSPRLSQTAGLSLRLHKSQDVACTPALAIQPGQSMQHLVYTLHWPWTGIYCTVPSSHSLSPNDLLKYDISSRHIENDSPLHAASHSQSLAKMLLFTGPQTQPGMFSAEPHCPRRGLLNHTV